MTPAELHTALARTPARSAHVISHRLLEARSREDCAALYGLNLEQWDVLFLRSVRDFETALGRAAPAEEPPGEAARISQSLTPELLELAAQREQLKRLIQNANAAYEASGAYTAETWARRIAIIVIVALTAYFYWREEQQPKKPIPYAPYLTEPKKP